ncbi:AGAP013418-PA-like protein [Anopheles sinensis]|uniref:AGAP013418-PA-like protein n=1 Tax=Anopheles sinensis TaxID=74873 RepID=A0A084W921_ANOSI|nr:AGAP013418-PA-like protein [Anopheles sinensis]
MYSSVSDGMSAEFGGASRAGYRREFEEMESRIRKCERQRAELERQFADLMRERAESERAAARAMKQRQKRLLEAERQRMERNESILRMLNKIDQQAASLAAKTDRLKMLKTQYEMYLMRTYSSAQSAYPSVYNPPMIAAPPPPMLPKAPQSPSKSSFAQYLSDLTLQQQQTSIDPIPPPTALSNYLATQQQKNAFNQSVAPLERPYSRMFDRGPSWETDVAQRRPPTAGSELVPLSNGGAKAKRFEMSNEDFIRYIDSEVLKEPIPTVSVVAPTPEGTMKKGGQVRGAAYLEDAGLSEDEQRPEAVDRLTEDVDQFSIVAKEEIPGIGEKKEEDDKNPMGPCETREEIASMAQGRETENNQPILEDTINNKSDYLDKEPDYITNNDPSPENKVTSQNKGIDDGYAGNNLAARIVSQDQEMYNVPQVEEESNISHMADNEHATEYPAEQRDISNQQPTVYPSEDQGPSQPYNDQFYQMSSETEPNGVLTNATDVLLAEESQLENPLPSSQEYVNQEQIPSNNDGAQHLPQQPLVQQSASKVGSQHWSAARQAMRTKAFPGVSSKVPSPEMTQPPEGVAEPQYEVQYDTDTSQANQAPVDSNVVQSQEGVVASGISENAEQNIEAYPEYVAGATEQSYYTEEPASDRQEASPAQGYQDDGMGQPVDYQTGPLDDGQQGAMYQYQQADGQQATYQEGQYVEGTSADQMQYQYPEGTDQTVTQYGTQEGYQDPNQQYQYDPQYYDQQQQQQGYDGQYYSEDPQQQQDQQQYYMEDPNQQQAHYEQQDPAQQQQDVTPVDQYQPEQAEGQAYYPTDAPYEAVSQHPVSTEGTDQAPPIDEPTSESSKPVVSQNTPDVPSVEAPPIADVKPPKGKPEKKSTPGKQTNDPKSVKKGSEPASDTPTVSSVNDESDFDFSTQ